MKIARMGCLVLGALAFVGCGGDQDETKHDGAAALPDLPPDRPLFADAPAPADTADGARDLAKDLPADRAADVAADLAKDAAADLAVGHDGPVDRVSGIDQASAETGGFDGAGMDGAADAQPALDGVAADALLSVVGFPCRGDDDCCTAVDGCMARTYLYSRAPGANPRPSFPVSTGGCLACIPSSVQVRCVSGQCFGERVSSYSSALYNAHCGYVPQQDSGAYALFDVVDAAAPIATKTSWTCGG